MEERNGTYNTQNKNDLHCFNPHWYKEHEKFILRLTVLQI